MVGGRSYAETPFNIATEGERQPGSSFKAFDLAAALEEGISPDSVWTSKEKIFYRHHGEHGLEVSLVHNDEGAYAGETHADERDRVLGQLGLRRSGPAGRHAEDRRRWPTAWASRHRSRRTRHDDRRPHRRA